MDDCRLTEKQNSKFDIENASFEFRVSVFDGPMNRLPDGMGDYRI